MWDGVATLHTVQDDSLKCAMRDRRFGYKCFSKADRGLAAYSDMYGGISTVLIPCSTFLFSSLFCLYPSLVLIPCFIWPRLRCFKVDTSDNAAHVIIKSWRASCFHLRVFWDFIVLNSTVEFPGVSDFIGLIAVEVAHIN